MSGANREPSSSVKNATWSGRSVATPAWSSVSTISSPASTPRLPSKRPPVPTVSMCEPTITGASVGSEPARVATTLPIASIATSRPRSRIHATTRSRPARSSSVSASRALPHSPFGPSIRPIWPSSSIRPRRRSVSIRSSDHSDRPALISAHRELERGDLGRVPHRRRRPPARRVARLARPSPASGRRCGRRVRSRSTTSRTRPHRRSGRTGCRRAARGRCGSLTVMSTRCGARCSIIDVSSVPPWMPMPSSSGAETPPWSGGTPGWARKVIRPWARRISRLATPTSAELPP